jgi:hypothetical protein
VLVLASSSEIASLLLSSGGIAHSRLKILLFVDECSTCEIKKKKKTLN